MLVATLCLGVHNAGALVQTTQQASRGTMVRFCGTPTPGKSATTAVQQRLNATMEV